MHASSLVQRRRLRRRLREERGASLVEFAFVLPILVTVVFGIVDFGMSYNNFISLRQGARDGARQAAVANYGTSESCTLTPVPTVQETRRLMCLTKDRIGLKGPQFADTRVKLVATTGYAVGSQIIVCAQYPLSSTTGLFNALLNGRQLKTKVTMRAEQTNANLVAAEETAPAGGDWSWCS